ncbi:MAG: SemiSWEET transporter [Nostoc sp. NMS7]|uniref:SemiSWEET family sugar transporter n=1 Tax=Nostoc sp. NMS7 TaxID=2815391 RepID=UPI0025E82A07|nr:SemiSWEET transporter [Nostoc sp. NMS7]MBN3947042.1 SemiSWEET transporter [Nostoc sp. NMS7]
MNATTILGLFAGILTTISFLPQVIKIWKTKSAKDVSLRMVCTYIAGTCMWLVNGFIHKDLPILMTNFFGLILNCLIVWFKIKYKK